MKQIWEYQMLKTVSVIKLEVSVLPTKEIWCLEVDGVVE
jgi:hypothetical protein